MATEPVGDTAGEDWLVADLLRVEDLMIGAAGSSRHSLVSEASLYLLKAGGKRLRPALVMITSRAGEPGRPESDLAAAALELVHLATLYHDDVIDEADSRRGSPSVNARWDNTVAILTGDYLFARASEISTDLGTEVCRLLARTIAVLCWCVPVIVALSRVYRGMHYVTDVTFGAIGGFALTTGLDGLDVIYWSDVTHGGLIWRARL
jgi:hypothetical protein